MGDIFLRSMDALSVLYERNVVNVTKANSCVEVLTFCFMPGSHLYGDLVVNDNYFFHDETNSMSSTGMILYYGILNLTISNNLFKTYNTESG